MPKVNKKSKKKIQPLPVDRTKLFIIIGLLLLSLLIIVIQTQQNSDTRSQAQITNCSVPDDIAAIDSEEQAMLTLVNNYRQQKGVGPLQLSDSLNRAAAWLSTDMQARNYVAHIDSFGREPGLRVSQCGGDFSGENIYKGFADAQSTFNKWIEDPAHEIIILNSASTFAGIGRVDVYWTIDFGTKIASEAPSPTTDVVPSPNCLGGCPTVEPTAPLIEPTIVTTQTPEVTETPLPTDSTPIDPTVAPDPSDPLDPQQGGSEGGFIGFLLGILLLFFSFLQSLFG